MISRGIYSLLNGEPTVKAAAPGGIYPVLLPKGSTKAALTYQVIGGSSAPTFETSGMQKLRVQFDAWGQSYEAANGVRDALRAFLNGYEGVLADGTFLQNAELISGTDYYEQDGQQFRCMCEFYFYFNFTS